MIKNKILAIQPEDIEEEFFSEKDLGGDKNNFIFIYLTKDSYGDVILNYQKPMDYVNNPAEETIIRNPNGIYELKIYSLNGNLLEKILFNPSGNKYFDIVVIPNYLNIGKIELTNLLKNKKEDIDLSAIAICNENNICESGEENICPLDCSSVNNSNYPKKISINENNLDLTTTSLSGLIQTPPPRNYFYQILSFSIFVFIILSLLTFILVKKIKNNK